MNRNCTTCNIMIDIYNYKKDRTVCKTCYNISKRKNNNIILTPNKNIENVDNNNNNDNNPNLSSYENRANVVIGQRNVGKTYYMLKVLEKIGKQRPIHIITRSPNQYPNYKTSNEIKPIINTKDQL